MSQNLPAAVLWDMDGTLVDTEPYWMSAERSLVASFGGSWTDDEALGLVGQGLEYSAQILQSKGVELDEEQIIVGLTERVLEQVRARIPWRPGARELLSALNQAGIPTALVTMSRRMLADHIAERAGSFGAIVGGEDVEHSKPDPEPYLRATTLLGVAPQRCIAIEDSRPGIASAVAAGAVTVGIPHMVELEPSPAYTLWPSLEGRTIADLATLLTGRTAA